MKISKRTLEILRNFSRFSDHLIVKDPKVIACASSSVVGICDIEEELPNFAVYNFREFLATINLFDIEEAEFEFEDRFVKIKCGRNSARYIFTDPDLISDNNSTMRPVATFKRYNKFHGLLKLTWDEIDRIKKAARILFPNTGTIENSAFIDFDLVKDGESKVKLISEDDMIGNNFKIDITKLKVKSDCNIRTNVDNFVMAKGDYIVSVSDGLLLKMQHSELPLMYFINARI